MFEYSSDQLQDCLAEILRQNISSDAWTWLQERSINTTLIHSAFVAAPRKTGKTKISLSQKQTATLQSIRKGFSIVDLTTDHLARVWLVLQLNTADEELYVQSVEKLFRDAEVNELVALYSTLPLLAFPGRWTSRCSEGIRNNIADVLTAIMCNNPYPSEHLDEKSWNQLVLKAFFTEKPIEEIIGLDERTNNSLANTLSDYAHERWAAHRAVNPQLWRAVGKYIDEKLFEDIKKLFASDNYLEVEAAALACYKTDFAPAKELLKKHPELYTAVSSGNLTWTSLAEKTKEHVL